MCEGKRKQMHQVKEAQTWPQVLTKERAFRPLLASVSVCSVDRVLVRFVNWITVKDKTKRKNMLRRANILSAKLPLNQKHSHSIHLCENKRFKFLLSFKYWTRVWHFSGKLLLWSVINTSISSGQWAPDRIVRNATDVITCLFADHSFNTNKQFSFFSQWAMLFKLVLLLAIYIAPK